MRKRLAMLLTAAFACAVLLTVLTSAVPPEDSMTLTCTSNGDGTCVISRVSGSGNIELPSVSAGGDTVIGIGAEAFRNCTGLTVVTIPEGVITIRDCAFQNCTGLTGVTVPASVISIGELAFDGEAPGFCLDCYSNSAAHYYAEGADILFILLDAHEHLFIASVETEASCDQPGTRILICSVCGYHYTEAIPMTEHSFTKWVIDHSPTLYQEGTKIRYCRFCGHEEHGTVERLTVDENDPDYGVACFTVVNAETLEPVRNAGIYLSTARDGECTLVTDENGKAAQTIAVGKQTVSVYAQGYLTRNLSVEIVPGIQEIPVIGISGRPLIETQVSSSEMTREEIEEVGIDEDDPDNQHVYRQSLEIRFKPELEAAGIVAYFNTAGECIGCGGTVPGGTASGGAAWITGGEGSGSGSLGRWIKYTVDGDTEATVYPVSEYLYLIIYGEAKWQKEMYDVEMIVINHSNTDTLEDCTAALELPEGLSLAAMPDGSQSLICEIGTVDHEETRSVHWYVRGDEPGSYRVKTRLNGILMPFGEEISSEYLADDPIQVLAGNAMHLNITVPRYVTYGGSYPVRFELVNVSDKPIYNLSSRIAGLEEGRVTYYSDGLAEEEGILRRGGDSVFVHGFQPGDRLVIETTADALIRSRLAEAQKQLTSGMTGRMKRFCDGFRAADAAIRTAGSAFACASELSEAADAYPALSPDADLSRRTAAEEIGSLAEEILEMLGKGETEQAVSKLRLLNGFADLSGLSGDPNGFGAFLDGMSPEEIGTLTAVVKGIRAYDAPAGTFDAIRALAAFVEALPVRYFVTDVIVSTLEDSTAEIPYSILYDETPETRILGVHRMGNSLRSLAAAETGETGVPWCLDPLESLDARDAVEYVKMQEAQTEAVFAVDSTGDVQFRVWSERSEAAVHAVKAAVPDKAVLLSSENSVQPFELSADNETAAYENGVLTFTGSGIVEISPAGTEGGVVYFEADGEIVRTMQIEIAAPHDCSSGEWEFVLIPTETEEGFAVKTCGVCGDLIDIVPTTLCGEHEFGERTEDLTEDGVSCTHVECAVCGYREYEIGGAEEEPAVIPGDVNGDGEVTNRDRLILARCLADWEGYSLSDLVFAAADINGDGELTNRDRMILARHLADWEGYGDLTAFRE